MTHIERVDVYLASADLPPRREDAPKGAPIIETMSIDADTYTLVACVVVTSDGVEGYGYGWSIGDARGSLIASSVQAAASVVIGRDPRRIEECWGRFMRFSNFLGRSGVAMMGMSIIDMALWDIRCKMTQTPLWLALGGHKSTARVYSNGVGRLLTSQWPDPGELTEAAEQMAAAGHRMLKTWVVDEKQLDSLRVAVENTRGRVNWAIDPVQLWDVGTAIRMINRMEDLNLVWVEDPIPYDTRGVDRIAASVTTPICTGENTYYSAEARRLIDDTAVQYLSIDLMRCGGITGWQKISALAEGMGAELVSHTYPQVATHLVCGTRNAAFVEDWPTYDGWVGAPVSVHDGEVEASMTPGIGLDFDPDVLAGAVKLTVK